MKSKAKTTNILEKIDALPMPDILVQGFNRYAKAVILDRAIPDARDGLKPVQRRIIYTMWVENNVHSRPTIKCARTVGNVIGKYHPHGDSSVYDAMVRLSQDWKMELPLLEFQGNNGSIDNDPAAAYRYTEARLAQVADYMVQDLDKDTVDMMFNFDDTLKEPTVLPSRFPNLLVNGANGIAVGAATNIPTHNLGEVIEATIYRLTHKTAKVENLREFIKGPDFPTGGIIDDKEALDQLYMTGQASFAIHATVDYTSEKGKIIISNIPYGEIKSNFVANLDKRAQEGKIDAINEIRDESTEDVRIVIELKKDTDPIPVVNFFRNKGAFKATFAANMLAIDDGHPRVMNLLEIIDAYINHQKDVILRRSKYDLKKKTWRLSIVKGLIKAVSILDEVIDLIRHSSGKDDSKKKLMEKYGFTLEQSEAIVTLQLYRLSNTDVTILQEEEKTLISDIQELNEIIANEDKLIKIIVNDLKSIKKTIPMERRTIIQEEKIKAESVDTRTLIAKEVVQVVITHDGYIKRTAKRSYDAAILSDSKSMPKLKTSDYTVLSNTASTHDYILLLTSLGQYFVIPVHQIPDLKWKDEGKHLNNIVKIEAGEKIVSAFVITEFIEGLNVAIVSKNGKIKRTSLKEFEQTKLTTRGLRAMPLADKDSVTGAVITHGNSDIIVITDQGYASRYNENEVPLVSLKAAGVKAMNLTKDTGTIMSAVSIYESEHTNLFILSNEGATRIVSTSNVFQTARLGARINLVRIFKNSPMKLVSAFKILNPEYRSRSKEAEVLLHVATEEMLLTLNIKNLEVSSLGIGMKKNIPDSVQGKVSGACYTGEIIDKSIEIEKVPVSYAKVIKVKSDDTDKQLSLFDMFEDKDED
ncbi:MAG TPA: DNA gyrase subunit A [Firmicutes bacterium]|nr:DNA gyrase subunit A [Bacillota bacterium]